MQFTTASVRTLFIVFKHNTGSQDYGHYLGEAATYPLHGGATTTLHLGSPNPGDFADGLSTAFINGAATTYTALAKSTSYRVLSLVSGVAAVDFNRICTTNGAESSSPDRVGNYTIAAIVGYSDALNETDREAVEDALGTYYGITITH
jgi:hypothetical protein